MCNCVHTLQDTSSKVTNVTDNLTPAFQLCVTVCTLYKTHFRKREHRESTERAPDAEEPPEEAATTDVALCPVALASARMPLGHMEDEAEEAEESDVALGHIDEEAEEAEDEAPDGGPWMRVSTA